MDMRKLVVAIIAMLALFTFIREYDASQGAAVEQAQIQHDQPN